MNTAHIGSQTRKPNATDRAIHLQGRGYTPGTFRNICGNANSYKHRNIGEPTPNSIFFNALINRTYMCCPTCIKMAIAKGLITVTVVFNNQYSNKID